MTETRSCQNCKQDFQIASEDFEFYEKIKVPPPTWCPQCREMRRWSFRNERVLYSRQCDQCKKQIISIWSPDKPRQVYCRECFNSDSFEPTAYGREFDFSRPFFVQFKELLDSVPAIALIGGTNCTNSDYVNLETDDKNCFMNIGGHFNEDCYYNTFALRGKNCIDNYWVFDCELMYESLYCYFCYRSFFCANLTSCNECWLCYDCRSCANCFGCVNQRGKQYMIFNKQYTKDEYEQKIAQLTRDVSALEDAKMQFNEERLRYPHRFAFIDKSEKTTGNYLNQSKDVRAGFDCNNVEQCSYVQIAENIKDVMDGSAVGWSECIYECLGEGWNSHSICTGFCFPGSNFSKYSLFCSACDYLFGCVSMKKNKHCIFNKQYTQEEYERLTAKIIEHMKTTGEWGEFFPPQLSPFGYNETVANIYFPITREQALVKGYPWQDALPYSSGKETMNAGALPSSLDQLTGDITKEILACSECKRNYKIIPPELLFYQQLRLQLPRKCLQCRYEDRTRRRDTSRVLHVRVCACAGKRSQNDVYENTASHPHGISACTTTFETTYAPESPEIIYCEECYQKEVV